MQWLKFTRKPDSQAKKTEKKYVGPAIRLEDIYTPSLLIPVDDGDNSTELADIDTTPAFDTDVLNDTNFSEPASVDDIDATDSTPPPLDVDAVDIADEELEDIPFITTIETEDTTAETGQSEIANESEIAPVTENVEPVSLDEPVDNVEPVSLDEPSDNVEPVSLDEPADNVEPVSLDEPTENVEPVSLDEPVENVEPVSLDEPAEEISSTEEIDTTITSETESENVAVTIDNSSETTDTNAEAETEEISEPVIAEIETPPPAIDFDLGSFTVGETGEIGIDFLFDGGGYKGQIAIISLEGMEKFEWGTSEFFKEAANRALSNSELGYLIISDASEGARFSAELGEANQNEGAYLGVKTFAMRAGDKFGFMLVPNGTVQQVFDNPNAGGWLRPLFSMATANPNDAYHIGQMADVTGDGNTFALEDMRVDGWTDKDYNDIVFQVRGATGKAVLMDDVVATNKDWRGTDMGVALIEYAKTYITPEMPVDEIESSLEDLMSELEELMNNSDNYDEEINTPEIISIPEDSVVSLPENEVETIPDNSEISADVTLPASLPEIEDPISDLAENSADLTITEIEKPVSESTEVVENSAPSTITQIEEPVSESTEVVENSVPSTVTEIEEPVSDLAENSADVTSPAPLPEIEEPVSDLAENSADVTSPAPLPEIEKPVSDITENSADVTESESPASQRDLSKVVKYPIFDSSEVSENNADFPQPESPTIPAIEKPVSDINEVADNSAEVNSPASPITADKAVAEETENAQPVDNSEPLKREIQDTETSVFPESQQVNSVKTELITRLENLTQNLKIQATEAPALGGKPVSQSLVLQVETITQKLKISGNLTSVPANTIALIERLENLVVKSMPVAIEPIVVPQFEFAKVDQPLVGVIDTGFAANNPDIDYSQVTLGRDYVDGDDNPLLNAGEGSEHGTHILGILKATQGNDIGIDGINDDAPIWVSRAIGSGKWADALVEFVDAAKVSGQPNAVVNLSLDLTQIDADGNVTTRYEFTPQERAAIEYARQHNVLIVAAAGNDGGVMSALGQASQEFDNIITVGAAERINDAIALSKAYNRADYSSYGYGLDIMASGGTIDNPELSLSGDSVGTMAGTSVATAKVTGAVSQVWAANPQLSYRQVIEIIKDTATDLGETGFDTATGAGLLNMVAAVSLAKATTPEEYDVLATVIPETWSGEGIVTPTERAAATEFMGKYYEWDSYTIKSGDTLSAIALRTMGSSSSTYVNFIAQKNGITNVNLIYQNQRILIPRQISAPVQNQPVIPDWQKAIDQAYATSPVNLGPPISGYSDATRSSQGTTGKYRVYQNGTIHWTQQYGAVPLWLDLQREYSEYSSPNGSGGWLGFPTKREYPWNGGMRTDFEGGYIFWDGNRAKAYPSSTTPVPLATPGQMRQYIVRSGDTVWGIAQSQLGNGNRWREIIKTPNGGTFTEAEAKQLKPGTYVYLPVSYQTGPGVRLTSTPTTNPVPNIILKPSGSNLTFQRGQQWATSTNYKFIFQPDGNLVLYNPQGKAIWATGTNGTTADLFAVQADGNVVLYDRGKAVWATDTAGNPGANFAIQGDGNLVVYSSNGQPLFNTGTYAGRIGTFTASPDWFKKHAPVQNIILKPGASNLNFSRGQQWITSTGYKFIFQHDGNLVLYNPQGKPIWATGTEGTGANRFSVQTDGNVVLYDGNQPLWATNTDGNIGSSFAIQHDGNLVVYSSSGKPIFNTGTYDGREGTRSASAQWLRDRNLNRFPGLQFSTVTSKATGKALDAGGSNSSVYPHSSPNSGNEFHQWGFEKVGDYYMIINKATGKALDAGGSGGTLPYIHHDPNKQNSYQLWKLTKVGDAYLIVNKATGRALDSGGAGGNQIYMYPNAMPGNNFHLWKLNLPNGGNSGGSGNYLKNIESAINDYFKNISGWSNRSIQEKWDRIGGDSSQYGQYSSHPSHYEWTKAMPPDVLSVYEDLSKMVVGSANTVTVGYAYDRGYHDYGYGAHSGIDIDTVKGKSIRSATKGRVVSVENHMPNGWWIAIDELNDNNERTGRRWWYGHLNGSYVRVGQQVSAAENIGATGDEAGIRNHLHLVAINTYAPVSNWNEVINGKGGTYTQNVSNVLGRTMSPLQAYWKSRNGIKE